MKFGIIVYPGSNCDMDLFYALNSSMGSKTKILWHKDSITDEYDCLILPGGFSFGDYLRCGAIAGFSKIAESIYDHARKGRLILGICNGFQILTEMKLLPGALTRNKNLKFICRDVYLRTENKNTPFTKQIDTNHILSLPIAHNDGAYYIDGDGLKRLLDTDTIIFRYCSRDGIVNEESNPNGSVSNIAGVMNEGRNILGLMPHPERACENILGGESGRLIFASMIDSINFTYCK